MDLRDLTSKEIVATATILLVGFLFAYRVNSTPITGLGGDSLVYHRLAVNLLAGNGFSQVEGPPFAPSLSRPPAYPAFLALLYSLFGRENYEAVRIAQILLILLSAVAAFLIVLEGFGDRLAAIAALAGCCFYSYFYDEKGVYGYLLAESLTVLSVTAGILLALRARVSDRARDYLLCGAMLALASLSRPSNLYFPLLLIPWLPRHRGYVGKIALLAAAAFLLPAAWAARNWARCGHFTMGYSQLGIAMTWSSLLSPDSGLGEGFDKAQHAIPADLLPEVRRQLDAAGGIAAYGGIGGAEVYAPDRRLFVLALETARRDPLGWTGRFLARVIGQWNLADLADMVNGINPVRTAAIGKILLKLALGLVALLGALRARKNPCLWPLIAFLAYNTALYALVGFGKIRFSHPARPAAIILFALGLSFIGACARRRLGSAPN